MIFIILSIVVSITSTSAGFDQPVFDTWQEASVALRQEILDMNMTVTVSEKMENLREALEELLDKMVDDGEKVVNNVEEFMQNPLNQLHLMRRYANQWPNIRKIIGELNFQRQKMKPIRPMRRDTTTAIAFLRLLDEVYLLDATNFSRGILPDVTEPGGTLTAKECFQIGEEASVEGKYQQCAKWMKEAFFRVQNGEECSYSITTIKDYFLECKIRKDIPDEDDYKIYKRLCRQKNGYTSTQKGLKCYLKYNENDPWFRIVSAKVEPISINPNITIYHGLIGKPETEFFQAVTRETLLKSTSRGVDTVIFEYPAAYNVLNKVEQERKLKKISESLRIVEGLQLEDLGEVLVTQRKRMFSTTFSSSTSPYEIEANDYHLDIYMNDVEHGGATVFKSPPLVVFPRRGTVVTWQKDVKVAYCPLLYGERWIGRLEAKEKQVHKHRKFDAGFRVGSGHKLLNDYQYYYYFEDDLDLFDDLFF